MIHHYGRDLGYRHDSESKQEVKEWYESNSSTPKTNLCAKIRRKAKSAKGILLVDLLQTGTTIFDQFHNKSREKIVYFNFNFRNG